MEVEHQALGFSFRRDGLQTLSYPESGLLGRCRMVLGVVGKGCAALVLLVLLVLQHIPAFQNLPIAVPMSLVTQMLQPPQELFESTT